MTTAPQATDVEALYTRYFPMIQQRCRRIVGDGAEAADVAQETFIRFWKKRDQMHNPAGAATWLYRTSTRIAIDRYRSQVRLPLVGDATEIDARPDEGKLESQVHSRRMLDLVANKIPRRELELAVLRRVDGLSNVEICAVTGHSERTTRRLLARFDERIAALTGATPS